MKKALILSGGTGGHIFPALSLSQALAAYFQVKFTATRPDPLFPNHQTFLLPFDIPSLTKGPISLFRFVAAFFRANTLLQTYQPDLLLSFGGYPAFPVLALIKSRSLPLFLIESNAKAGKVNQWFSPYAQLAFIQFPEAAADLSCPCSLTGLPTRPLQSNHSERRKPFVLFIGGSQGARSLADKALYASHFLQQKGLDTLLIAGNLYPSIRRVLNRRPAPLTLYRFVKNPLPLFSAAEVVVSRAGASTLAELTLTNACPLLLPYPFADRHHQYANALSLQKRTGVPILPDTLSPNNFATSLLAFLEQRKLRQHLRKRMKQAAYPNAAQTICTALKKAVE